MVAHRKTEKERQLAGGRLEKWGGRSRILDRKKDSPALYKSFNTLCTEYMTRPVTKLFACVTHKLPPRHRQQRVTKYSHYPIKTFHILQQAGLALGVAALVANLQYLLMHYCSCQPTVSVDALVANLQYLLLH